MKQFILSFLLAVIVFSNELQSQINSYPFEVKQFGQGSQAIVFIPGFSCSGEVWNETKALFEKNYTCYVLTMAGFAGVKPQKSTRFEAWKEGIAQFIKDKKLQKPILIGHSMGGGLAMALAADYSDMIEKIVVVDALPCLMGLTNPKFRTAENPNCDKDVEQFKKISQEQFYNMQLQSMTMLVADTFKQKVVATWSAKSDRETFAKMFCDFSNTDLRSKIANAKCPALILMEPSFLGFQEKVKEQYAKYKNADIRYATKGLHFVMYDDVNWYNQQLLNFIK
jgi:pimeloyl-ACP methyl ester carboxylesterase